VAFVPQEDCHAATLSVRETVGFASECLTGNVEHEPLERRATLAQLELDEADQEAGLARPLTTRHEACQSKVSPKSLPAPCHPLCQWLYPKCNRWSKRSRSWD
jgi:hypothetical protein